MEFNIHLQQDKMKHNNDNINTKNATTKL